MTAEPACRPDRGHPPHRRARCGPGRRGRPQPAPVGRTGHRPGALGPDRHVAAAPLGRVRGVLPGFRARVAAVGPLRRGRVLGAGTARLPPLVGCAGRRRTAARTVGYQRRPAFVRAPDVRVRHALAGFRGAGRQRPAHTRRRAGIPAVLFVPKGNFHLIDDWNTVGLRGTGACSVEVEDAIIPPHRVRQHAQNVRPARQHKRGSVPTPTPRGAIVRSTLTGMRCPKFFH